VSATLNGLNPEVFQLIQQYGYWLMAFGAIIEGETFLVAGGVAAHAGLFHLWGLIALALVGSTIHDCALFFIGRFFGNAIVKSKPQLYARAEGILSLFERYGVLIIIALRFAYGLRTVIPTVLGMSQISAKKFIFYDIIGGIIWSCTFVLAGYIFGAAINKFLEDFEIFSELPFYIALGVVVGGGLVFFISLKIFKRKKAVLAKAECEAEE
jgi:membrane protein DedA with SNARE-associated domain